MGVICVKSITIKRCPSAFGLIPMTFLGIERLSVYYYCIVINIFHVIC